ncbi:hypothetical protein PHYBLDRAFT_174528 [Phycomyces blakesleeanus NRRL 1555(-)]|uniref:Uncharacterized protein n=1 Tax=Phycomyces blakesleeanus (strain ATCC 8743b / DSM 1359 / FGSC 10004 / NBRC 33097 / NRRL 1555) TaxID=763407 RepID=A0A167K2R7_PHYB8|nr:hypothetical protein PHYBLDRAFT_174528 [Phycomyces blakesleeanus NRRL 1555(-)]OAD67146.1 hypothetical protein PHYBLDRAFT_174528 [Phycomyces blakesleeanus NRRL 1555(-)]|eukprot:XP_018285186.1 hypothetical protein PHYBLDRAFT_174528 [Phycomyces blakesleeanus NRRL 1555(-)]
MSKIRPVYKNPFKEQDYTKKSAVVKAVQHTSLTYKNKTSIHLRSHFLTISFSSSDQNKLRDIPTFMRCISEDSNSVYKRQNYLLSYVAPFWEYNYTRKISGGVLEQAYFLK